MPEPRSPRIIPAIETLRRRPDALALEQRYGAAALLDALRSEAGELRTRLARPDASADLPDTEGDAAQAIVAGAARRLSTFESRLRPVINATGVVIHTNLGRAPLPETALARIRDVAAGYATLEYDIERGARGRRDVHAEPLLAHLTGAEAAVVVNNNAAATLLLLSALARGREVIISRGELVEIGGGFRVPDVMAQGGAMLREVGTTNRTRLSDYAAAIGPRTAAILRVHPSNFRIEGFVERPALADLAGLAHTHDVVLAEDLGSGYLGLPDVGALVDEPSVQDSIRAGVDILCFSGDKLLGGPQCGIIVGRRELVEQVRRHPLMRALRVDKLTYAALEPTLQAWAIGRATADVPVARMVTMPAERIRTRAEAVRQAVTEAGLAVSLEDGHSTIGGGSAPGSRLDTTLLVVVREGTSCEALEARLRRLDRPIVGRIERDRVVLDLRTVAPEDDAAVIDGVRRA